MQPDYVLQHLVDCSMGQTGPTGQLCSNKLVLYVVLTFPSDQGVIQRGALPHLFLFYF